ncbi:MAG: aspartate--tRNA(Asn) ligase [Candidatus Njordarchaeales archaeon]
MRKLKYFSNEISPDMRGKRVRVAGWVIRIRDLGKIVFVRLRDREGELQVIFKKGEVSDDLIRLAKELNPASAIIVDGIIREANTAEGFEIVPQSVYVVPAEAPLPIDLFKETTELDKRIRYRTLDLRILRNAAIFKIRSLIVNSFREFLLSNNFVEIHTPVIALYVAEGGANVFQVDYFKRKAYLRQSPQLYKQLMAGALERVFEIGPAFRAEPSYTIRHLTEFTSLDVEMAWINDVEDLMDLLEDIVIYIIRKVRIEGQKIFELLGKDPPEIPEKPFPVMSYREAVMLLKQAQIPLEGKEIPHTGEKYLGEIIKKRTGSDFFFITDFPWEIRPFYTMKYEINTGDEIVTKSIDLIYKGMEIATGSQREHRYEILVKQMREKGLDPERFGYYLKAFKYGMPPHGGFAIGLDRLTMLILDLKNVREAVLFPRDPETLEP